MIDLQFQYSPFANLKISHEYFEKDAARHLVFSPTAATQNTLLDLDLLYRRDEDGFKLLVDQSMKDRLAKVLEGRSSLSFGFWLGNSNPYFSSITEDAPQNFSQVLYLSNNNKSKEGAMVMHDKDFVSSTDLISVVDAEFSLDGIDAEQSLMLTTADGYTLATGESSALLDKIQGLPEGCFKIVTEKGEELKSFLSLPFTKPKYLVGYVEVKYDKAQIEYIINEIESGNIIPTQNFDVAFKAKSAYWRYLLVPQYAKSLDKSKLLSDQKDIKFQGPTKVNLRNGGEAIEFKSEKPLKLAEYSDLSFQLTGKNGQGSAGKILVKRMPLPSVDCLIQAEDNKTSIAEIIFNL